MSDSHQAVRAIRNAVPETRDRLLEHGEFVREQMQGNESLSRSYESTLKPLTARQFTAINLLTMGKSVIATAKTIGVCESTLHRWKATSPLFMAELSRRQVDLFDTMIHKLRLAMNASVNELHAMATSKMKHERKEVMRDMLKLLRPERYLAPRPQTDAGQIIDERIREQRQARGEVAEMPITDEERRAATEAEYLAEIETVPGEVDAEPEATESEPRDIMQEKICDEQTRGIDPQSDESQGQASRHLESPTSTTPPRCVEVADPEPQRERMRPSSPPLAGWVGGGDLSVNGQCLGNRRSRDQSLDSDTKQACHMHSTCPEPHPAQNELATPDSISTLAPHMTSRKSFLPGQPWPDNHGVHLNAHGAGLLEHEGAFYLFGEHKIAGKIGNSAQVGVHVYRSTDLYNWQDAGIALSVVVDDEASDIVRGCVIERPKVIYNRKTKQFVMYFHLEMKGQGYHAARTAIATASKPEGPYTFIRSLRPNAGHWPMNVDESLKTKQFVFEKHPTHEQVVEGVFCQRDVPGGQMARDMTLFVDDDQTAYLICSAEENYTLNIHELTADYLSFTGRYVRILPGGHNEAPAIFKHVGTYHLLASGCTGWAPNAARSATAPSMFGPWTPVSHSETPGPNPCVGTNPHNGHGPKLTFGGQSTHIQPMPGVKDRWIAMFDVWTPENPIDGGYIWLPCDVVDGRMQIEWRDEWTIGPRSTA